MSDGGIKAVVVSGAGFLADAYDLFVIDLVLDIISVIAVQYGIHVSTVQKGSLASATLLGAIVGQLGFGFLADKLGRRPLFVLTGLLVSVGAIGSACVSWGGEHSRRLMISVERLRTLEDEQQGKTIKAHEEKVETEEKVYRGGNETVGPPQENIEQTLVNERESLGPSSVGGFFFQFWLLRFLLGLGIGGEYPLSATVTSEHNDTGSSRSVRAVAAVFSMQGVGMLCSPLIVLLLLSFLPLWLIWRVVLAVGAVPTAVVLWWRWQLHDREPVVDGEGNGKRKKGYQRVRDLSRQVTIELQHGIVGSERSSSTPTDDHQAENPEGSLKRGAVEDTEDVSADEADLQSTNTACAATSPSAVVVGKTVSGDIAACTAAHSYTRQSSVACCDDWLALFGSCASWFLIDVTLYGNGSFKSVVLGTIYQPVSTMTEKDRIGQDALLCVYVALMALPGYFLSVCLLPKVGLRRLQLYGFSAIAISFLLLGILQLMEAATSFLSAVLFGLTFLFSNFGPNTTTFIMPTVLFPSSIRATCHGLSAASGKIGGALGAQLFVPLQAAIGLGWVLISCSGVAIAGAIVTHYCIPTTVDSMLLAHRPREVVIERTNSHRGTTVVAHANELRTST
eukprot:GHVS01086251.1.p1 GENE.GHVS01086251.1~~GHVS01086251.1.p1  ORF type:complete len:622 (+),score=85.29 GHVS01086251.1:234-2099(+)